MTRIQKKFQQLKTQQKTAFIPYICGGDPDFETSLEILQKLPQFGADIIELGVPFLDPAGDGPTIEEAAKNAIKNGMTLQKTLKMVEIFRQNNQETPILLMGYYNSFLKYGLENFFLNASNSGVDGVLIVDLPIEEQNEIASQIKKYDIDFINLISPLSSDTRIAKIADQNYSSGFLYLLSMLGITGTKEADLEVNKNNLAKIRAISDLPISIGFGIKTPTQGAKFAKAGFDGVVVGSAIVKQISDDYKSGASSQNIVANALELVQDFSKTLNQK